MQKIISFIDTEVGTNSKKILDLGGIKSDGKEFYAFFSYLNYTADIRDIDYEIRNRFHNQICEYANINSFINDYPIELSYCLSLINTKSRYSITPRGVLKNYPDVERIMYLLRNKPCLEGCNYCN